MSLLVGSWANLVDKGDQSTFMLTLISGEIGIYLSRAEELGQDAQQTS